MQGLETEKGHGLTHAFVDLWLVGSCLTASSFSSSSLFLLDPGTDLAGSWSSKANPDRKVPA